MKTFKHYHARSLKKAAALLAKYNGKAKVNAGGTDLLGCLKDQCLADYPEAVIDIKGIRNLDYIKATRRELKIGALAKLADIMKSPEVRKEYSLLSQAIHTIASPNLRNMATVGGNLAQDIRCWYYRYPQQIGGPITCLRKGGKICNAAAGDHRYHSIFGAGNGCFAVNPSDLATAFVAMDALVVTNKRTLAAQDFFATNLFNATVLECDELIKEIRIPKPPQGARQSFQKFTLRKPVDFAIVSVALVLVEKGAVCSDVRIALGAVGPAPIRAVSAEQILKGKTIDETCAIEAAKQAFANARPLKMNAFKIQIGETLLKRAILGIPE
jgi:xanthine dehydrogenase YagS FAD-binding subunit